MWVNTSGINNEAFQRLCYIGDYLQYSSGKDTFASITTLNNPARITILQRRYLHDIQEDPVDIVWRIIGSAVHDLTYKALGYGKIEQAKLDFAENILTHYTSGTPGIIPNINSAYDEYQHAIGQIQQSFLTRYIAEERLFLEIHGKKISGANDIYDQSLQKIIDYKVTSVDKLLLDSFKEWTQQLNGYAYLRYKNGYPVQELEIDVFLRDWMRNKAKYDRSYPQHSIVLLPIELWDVYKQQYIIENAVEELIVAETLSDDQIPICSLEDRWEKPSQVAVVEVQQFTITETVKQQLYNQLLPLDTLSRFPNMIGKVYRTRQEVLQALEENCGTYFRESYGEEVLQLSAQRKVDETGKPVKRALRVVNSKDDALDWIDWKKGLECEWALEYRPSVPQRCAGNYCGVRDYCCFWKQYEREHD